MNAARERSGSGSSGRAGSPAAAVVVEADDSFGYNSAAPSTPAPAGRPLVSPSGHATTPTSPVRTRAEQRAEQAAALIMSNEAEALRAALAADASPGLGE